MMFLRDSSLQSIGAEDTGPQFLMVPSSAYGAQLMHAPDMWVAFDQIQEETHTGRHHRNHFVKVPTAPGEPCRGRGVRGQDLSAAVGRIPQRAQY